MMGAGGAELDGLQQQAALSQSMPGGGADAKASGGIVKKIATRSQVGFVPMNPGKVNQDSYIAHCDFDSDPSQYYFGVMDGHGQFGHDVSGMLKRKLGPFLIKEPTLKSNPPEALKKSFVKTNADTIRSHIECSFSGSTCVTVFIRGTTMYCANVGDSRAVVGTYKRGTWHAVALSDDHKPDLPAERKRILEHDGRVEAFRGYDGKPVGPARVWLKRGDAPGLAMSRSMGDTVAASVGVIAVPDVIVHNCTSSDKVMILGSDGVWEFISNQEAVEFVGPYVERGEYQKACDELCKLASQKWRAEEDVIDDITAVIVALDVP